MKCVIPALLMALVWIPVFAESGRLAPVYDSSSMAGQVGQTKANRNLFEALDRLEQLQIEVQQMRGALEEQSHKISELEKRQEAMYLDVDQRFQNLGGTDAPIAMPTEPAEQTPDIKPPAELPVANSVPVPVATPEVNQAVVAPILPSNRSSYKRPVLDEKQAYQQAYETLRSGSTIKSIDLFKEFLVNYPRGSYADNASYWLAEAYKLDRQTNLARLTFQNLITRFPNSPKIPDAKLKLGFIEAELNNLDQARRILTDITTRYPGTSVAYLAKKKLAEISRY